MHIQLDERLTNYMKEHHKENILITSMLPYLRRLPAGGFSKIYRRRGNCRIKSRSFSSIPSSTWERPDPPYPTAHGGNSDTWTLQIF